MLRYGGNTVAAGLIMKVIRNNGGYTICTFRYPDALIFSINYYLLT